MFDNEGVKNYLIWLFVYMICKFLSFIQLNFMVLILDDAILKMF